VFVDVIEPEELTGLSEVFERITAKLRPAE
jgi:hypothetical protein